MNRPIKYQAWQQYAMQMYEVVGLQWSAAMVGKFSKIELLSMDGRYTAYTVTGAVCDSFVLREFTGWHDHSKPAKEVYEGDIVQFPSGHRGVVTWDTINDGWRVHTGDTSNLRNNEMIVIGNVYENPELVKKEE